MRNTMTANTKVERAASLNGKNDKGLIDPKQNLL
jgi:hypothetical protein